MTSESKVNFLFIHGAGGTSNKWRTLIPYFDNSEYLTVDLPGRGANNEPLATSIRANAEAISKQITSDTIVVGHSMGGLIGIELAAMNDHVKGLALVSSFYELPVHPSMLASFEAGEFPDALFYASYNKDIDEGLLEIEKREKDEADMTVVSTDFNACNSYKDGKETLANLSVPVIAIYGEDDRLLPPEAGAKLKAVNEAIDVHAIAGEKHYIMLENPQLVSELLHQFNEEKVRN